MITLVDWWLRHINWINIYIFSFPMNIFKFCIIYLDVDGIYLIKIVQFILIMKQDRLMNKQTFHINEKNILLYEEKIWMHKLFLKRIYKRNIIKSSKSWRIVIDE